MTTHIRTEMGMPPTQADLAEALEHFKALSDEDKKVFANSFEIRLTTTKAKYDEVIARHEQREAALVVIDGPPRRHYSLSPENISIADLRYDQKVTEINKAFARKEFPNGVEKISHTNRSSLFHALPVTPNPHGSNGVDNNQARYPSFNELLAVMNSKDGRLQKSEDGSVEQAALALRIWGLQQEPARDIRLGYFTKNNKICTARLVGGAEKKKKAEKALVQRPKKKVKVEPSSEI